MKIFLIGFMGSGKTTVGRKLASKLKLQFLDIDQWIETEQQTTIKELFDKKGEIFFRELEASYLRKLKENKNIVVSTGGGLPCHSQNMEFMSSEGLTVYLRMTPEALFSRLKQGENNRPLLSSLTEEEMQRFVEEKLKERASFYEEAQIIVDGLNLNISELAEKIRNSIQ